MRIDGRRKRLEKLAGGVTGWLEECQGVELAIVEAVRGALKKLAQAISLYEQIKRTR